MVDLVKGGRVCGREEMRNSKGRKISHVSRRGKLGVTRRRFPVLGRVLVQFGGYTTLSKRKYWDGILRPHAKAVQALPALFARDSTCASLRRFTVHFRIVVSLL